MTDAKKISQRLDQLEAERMIITIELRTELLRAARQLLPTAIDNAKPRGKKPGSPALLRLITRLAMRPTQIDRPPNK
jgi:hypothetical protein